MHKYLTIFSLSWQNEFTYRLNFILWRLRQVLRFLLLYFLWSGIFVSKDTVFGYSQQQIFTYVFMVLAVQTLVLSAPPADHIGDEISQGDLSNYLLKPVNYLKFWFTRDLASKFLNLSFAVFEIGLLWFFLKPELTLPSDPLNLIAFIVLALSAMATYFFISISARLISFWTPDNTWGFAFLLMVIIETLSGGIFPLDILPPLLQTAIQFTPFPYLLYFPIAVFIEKIAGPAVIQIAFQSLLWSALMFLIMRTLWQKGLKVYGSEGK